MDIEFSLFRPWFNYSSPNIVPTPTPPTSHISTGAQPPEMPKLMEKVRGYGCQRCSQHSLLHSMRRASVKSERAAPSDLGPGLKIGTCYDSRYGVVMRHGVPAMVAPSACAATRRWTWSIEWGGVLIN